MPLIYNDQLADDGNYMDYRVGESTKAANTGVNTNDMALRDVLFDRMSEGIVIDQAMQAIAYAKMAYRKEIMIPQDYADDVILPYDEPKPTPLNSFLSRFKRG